MDAESFNEPWRIEHRKHPAAGTERRVIDCQSVVIDAGGEEEYGIEPICFTDKQIERIVACVNACRGISTKELEEYGDGSLRHVIDCLEGLVEPSSGNAMWDS